MSGNAPRHWSWVVCVLFLALVVAVLLLRGSACPSEVSDYKTAILLSANKSCPSCSPCEKCGTEVQSVVNQESSKPCNCPAMECPKVDTQPCECPDKPCSPCHTEVKMSSGQRLLNDQPRVSWQVAHDRPVGSVCTLPEEKDDTRWVLVPTENTAYQSWQVRASYLTYCRLFNGTNPLAEGHKPPHFVRIVYSETGPERRDGKWIHPDPFTGESAETLMPTAFVVERNPMSWAATQDFAVWSRALAISRWMDQQPRDGPFWSAPSPGPTVALYEPDMLFLRWSEVGFTAEPGTVRAPPQGYMNPKAPGKNAEIVATLCKRNCDTMVGVDVPWIMRRDDLWKILVDWMTTTRALRVHETLGNNWVSDMWGLQIAAVQQGLKLHAMEGITCHVQYGRDDCNKASAMHYTYDVESSVAGQKYFFSKRRFGNSRPKRAELVPAGSLTTDHRPSVATFLRMWDDAWQVWFPDDAQA
eukprot:TRINITY_DN21627_c0_g1_i1.p1 TRINITY_DN21627_c0_g1~~TRINITY_DN21627_c0_g1_i1.p1  ORF type:complete len:471 (+),score=82.62 TRINITY_DN21627_c0_g1_i1:118-1530(+)